MGEIRDTKGHKFTGGDIDVDTNKIINLAAPTNPNDAARLADCGSSVAFNGGSCYPIEDLNAASVDYIHTLAVYANGDHVDVTSPPHARIVTVTIKNNTGGMLALDDTTVVVVGKNQFGESKTENIHFAAQNVNGGNSVIEEGVIAFRVITKVTLPIQTTGDGNWQFSVGVEDIIGVNRKITAAGDIFAVTMNTNDLIPIPTIDTVNWTIDLSVIVAGSIVTIWFGV